MAARLLTLLLLITSLQAQAFFFPEMPFCPLGGPPGWANRIINDDYYRYPPAPHPAVYRYQSGPPAYSKAPLYQRQYSPGCERDSQGFCLFR